jgi:hypothetical protein
MAFRLYLVPAIGTGTQQDPRRAKYLSAMSGYSGGMDYGFQPVFLTAADLSPANDAALVANADVFGFPVDLSGQLSGGDANTASAALESFFIPANWITGSLTWLEVARTIAGMFQYLQRLNGTIGNVVLLDGTGNKTLNTQFNQIDPTIQAGIISAAQSLGYDTSFIQNNTQVRALIKNFADQWGQKPFIFGPFII